MTAPSTTVSLDPSATTHAYPPAALAAEYARAAAGLALVGLPLAFAQTLPAVTAFLASAAVLFAYHGLRTAAHHLRLIEVSETGIRAHGPAGGEIPWHDLRRLRLCYYSTRRDRSNGWLQLVLDGRRRRLRIDSRVEGFDRLTRRAVSAALHNRLSFDEATAYNITSLGIAIDPAGVRPGRAE